MRSLPTFETGGGAAGVMLLILLPCDLFDALTTHKRWTGCVYCVCVKCTSAFAQQLDKPKLC